MDISERENSGFNLFPEEDTSGFNLLLELSKQFFW